MTTPGRTRTGIAAEGMRFAATFAATFTVRVR